LMFCKKLIVNDHLYGIQIYKAQAYKMTYRTKSAHGEVCNAESVSRRNQIN